MSNLKELFTATYSNGSWLSEGSKSGPGSTLPYTVNFRNTLLDIIKSKKVKTIFDCSCGDWTWMKEIQQHLPKYVGNDIVESLIEENTKKYESDNIKFICGDMLDALKTYETNSFDLIICRHTLEHLPTQYCIDAVREIKRVGKFGLITSRNGENSEIKMDGVLSRIVNLEKDEYYEILGEPTNRHWDTMVEPDDNTSHCNFYKFK